MEGDFGISDSNFTHPATQEKVNQLSQNAQTETREKMAKEDKVKGKDQEAKEDTADRSAPPVVSDFRGHVVLKNGVATFSNLSFYIPGAHARMQGTYDLISGENRLARLIEDGFRSFRHGTRGEGGYVETPRPVFQEKAGGGRCPGKDWRRLPSSGLRNGRGKGEQADLLRGQIKLTHVNQEQTLKIR